MPVLGSVLGRIRRQAAPASKSLLFRAGAYDALRRVRPSSQLAILRYHAVCGPEGDDYAEPGICVTPAAFETHVAYLAANYRVLSLPEAVACLRDGGSLPLNAVALTFDDGYADNLPAARVLHHHGLTATFYLTAGCLVDGEPFWPSEIRHLLRHVPGPFLRLRPVDDEILIPCGTSAERRAALRIVSRLFKIHSIPVRERMRASLRAQAAGGGSAVSPMLTWDQVREMHRLGMTIGAHTLTHPNLPNAGYDDARREIVGSKDRLQEELGAPVTMFSYPNGGAERYMTPEIAVMVREAGFEAATTSWNGFASVRSDLYALERIQVQERVEDLAFGLEVERFAFRPAPRRGQHAPDRG